MKNAAWLMLLLSLGGCDLLAVACTTEARPGIAVVLVDSATGGPIVSDSVLVIAIDGAYADTAGLLSHDDVSSVGLALERAGTYRVEVNANGYQPWMRGNVRISKDECHVRTVQLTARLQR